ncbi:MAG: LPS export ABC transporter periplasmic protein LptC [Candidatus Omnitrophica bacterium]|nr:LPS export ABC transporter periplasmic protein LptC [Candidatus Omnitrophota bacterium]MBU4488637.1 LPS export ABC transporter periplasmic protein LptC [Candidatus Omnitrophota bacterium]
MYKKLLILSATIVLALAVSACAKKPEAPKVEKPAVVTPKKTADKKLAPAKDLPAIPEDAKADINITGLDNEQKILSFDMTGYTKDGQRKWAIKGESADIMSETVELNNIEADTYDEDRTVKLEADSGTYDKHSGGVKLEENVVVTTSDGIKLTADWFEWDSKTNIVTSDSKVEVRKDDLYACGMGASASAKSKEVRLNRDVLVKQGDITATSKGPLHIDYSNKKASFTDKVKVVDPRGELTADRLDIFFNTETKEIERIVAEGSVELKRGSNIAKGQKITYTPEDGKAILTGNPEIYIYSEKDMQDAFIGN